MLPLSDLRVLSVEQFGAGPWGTMQLADLGAEVIKLEDPGVGGDVGRFVPPYDVDGSSLYFESFAKRARGSSSTGVAFLLSLPAAVRATVVAPSAMSCGVRCCSSFSVV